MIYYRLKFKITNGYYEETKTHAYEVSTDKIWYSMEQLIEFFSNLTLFKLLFYNDIFEIEVIINIKNYYDSFTYNIRLFVINNIFKINLK